MVECPKNKTSTRTKTKPSDKERDHFPAGQPGKIMPEEKERKTNDGDDSGNAEPGNLELDDRRREFRLTIRAARAAVSQNASCSKPLGSNCTTSPFKPAFRIRSGNRLGDAVGQDRFAIDFFRRFLRVEGKERAFWMNHAIADFHFLVLVHEGLADVRIMAVAQGRAADRAPTNRRSFFPSPSRGRSSPVERIGAAAPIALTGAM